MREKRSQLRARITILPDGHPEDGMAKRTFLETTCSRVRGYKMLQAGLAPRTRSNKPGELDEIIKGAGAPAEPTGPLGHQILYSDLLIRFLAPFRTQLGHFTIAHGIRSPTPGREHGGMDGKSGAAACCCYGCPRVSSAWCCEPLETLLATVQQSCAQ